MPIYAAFKRVLDMLSNLVDKHERDVLLCFDNLGHPMKAEEQARRRNERAKQKDKLKAIYMHGAGNDEDLE